MRYRGTIECSEVCIVAGHGGQTQVGQKDAKGRRRRPREVAEEAPPEGETPVLGCCSATLR